MTAKMKINVYKSPKAAALWAIVFPGLGQLYNRDYLVGFTVIFGEILFNFMSNLNIAILYAFTGNIQQSFEVIDYRWGLFYPSIYAFSIWDAYNRAKEINYQLAKQNVPPPKGLITSYTGLFFGFLIGMHFGLYWLFLISPVFGGLLVGIVGALVGHRIEKIYVKRKGIKLSEL